MTTGILTDEQLDAMQNLDNLADKLADERQAWERLVQATPGTMPHVALTCTDIAETADHGYKTLVRMSARLLHGLISLAVVDAYLDAARNQLEHLTIARGLIGSIVRPVDDRNRKTGGHDGR